MRLSRSFSTGLFSEGLKLKRSITLLDVLNRNFSPFDSFVFEAFSHMRVLVLVFWKFFQYFLSTTKTFSPIVSSLIYSSLFIYSILHTLQTSSYVCFVLFDLL